MCAVLRVSKSGYYYWVKRRPCKRKEQNQELLVHIRRIYQKSRQTYGSPRITKSLRKEGIHVSRPRVARIMKKANIRVNYKKKFKVTTDSKHNYPVAENLLNRDFRPNRIVQACVSDITYIRTRQGWLYLTIILSLADRKVIGWALSSGLSASQTSVAAWKMAIRNRPVTGPLIFHSDRGVQYACHEFTSLLKANKHIRRSMSRKGNCWDNAVAESFFNTLKREWISRFVYKTRKQAELSIFDYIESWYNTNRIHSTIEYNTPREYEQKKEVLKYVA
jgi:transposase InsO family protein